MKNPKCKGNQGERNWAAWLREQNIDSTAYRNLSSGNNIKKSDVHNSLNCNFEVKTCKKINLLKAYKQSEEDARLSHSVPYVVVHFDKMPDNTWLVIMNNFDWADLLKKSQEPKTIEKQLETSEKYKITRAIQSLKEVLKIFN